MKNSNAFWSVVLAATALCGCVSSQVAVPESTASSAASREASPEVVSRSFADGVTTVCVPMFPEIGDLKEVAKASGIELERLRAGSAFPGGVVTAMPVYRTNDGITHIRQNLLAGACEVFAYGAPVSSTFDKVGARLTDETIGFLEVADENVAIPEFTFSRVFEKPEADIIYVVTLSGSEPGAPGTMSSFSTLRATVGFKKAD